RGRLALPEKSFNSYGITPPPPPSGVPVAPRFGPPRRPVLAGAGGFAPPVQEPDCRLLAWSGRARAWAPAATSIPGHAARSSTGSRAIPAGVGDPGGAASRSSHALGGAGSDRGLGGWLGREDSNLRSGIQSPAPYRLATPQAARRVAPPAAASPAIESGGPATVPVTQGPQGRPAQPAPSPPAPPPAGGPPLPVRPPARTPAP